MKQLLSVQFSNFLRNIQLCSHDHDHDQGKEHLHHCQGFHCTCLGPPPICFAENNSRQKASTIIRLTSLIPFPERSQSCPACCPISRNISWYILLNLQVMTAVLSLVPITSSWLETKFPLLNLFQFCNLSPSVVES